MKKIFILGLLLASSLTFPLKRVDAWDEEDFKRIQDVPTELTPKDLEEILDLIKTQIESNDKVIEEAIKRIEEAEKKENDGK